MPSPFEVVLDNTGRVNHFIADGHEDTPLTPESMVDHLDGGERVLIKDVEYDITQNGSVIHPDVEVTEPVFIEAGVRLDAGTTFHSRREEDSDDTRENSIWLGAHSRIKGTEIHIGVEIGEHAFILAKSIGRQTMIGSYVRIGTDTEIGSRVMIGETTKIDVEGQISSDVKIGKNVRLGFNTRVNQGAEIGDRSRIGVFAGVGPRGVNQDGPFIPPNKILPPSTHIRE